MKVHLNNGKNKPICGEENFTHLTEVKNCTDCANCQKLRTEAINKLRFLRRLDADKGIVSDYLRKGNVSDDDLESYRIRLGEIETEWKKNNPKSVNEAYIMSELSMPITAEVEHV